MTLKITLKELKKLAYQYAREMGIPINQILLIDFLKRLTIMGVK